MITIEKLGIILGPSNREFDKKAASNAGVYQDGNTLHLLYSAVSEDNIYTILFAKTAGAIEIINQDNQPFIQGELEFEKNGVKNPRVVKIEDTYYITYTANDGFNFMGALATSSDLISLQKHGVITPCINYKKYSDLIESCGKKLSQKYYEYFKFYEQIGLAAEKHLFIRDADILLFPRKINGKFVLLHQIFPSIQIVYFDDWKELTSSFWENYLKNLSNHILIESGGISEVDCVGIGCPPIETEFGWLIIYQGVQITTKGKIFHAMAALLQSDKPENILSRLPYPLISPTHWWEKEDEVNRATVTPSGTAVFGDDLYVYYGASGKYLAVAKMNLKELLLELVKEL